VPRARLTPDLIEAVADRFRAMGEPARLRILSALRAKERCVTDLERETGLNQANLSRHLQVLSAAGLVKRRKDGLFVYYALADSHVLRLCELMCGRVAPSRAGTPAPRR
jgi:DNA-binding transcriptional ArsR family regulator